MKSMKNYICQSDIKTLIINFNLSKMIICQDDEKLKLYFDEFIPSFIKKHQWYINLKIIKNI